MRLNIRHVTRYEYEPAAPLADLRLRLFPGAFKAQRSLRWSVSVNGAPIAPNFVNGFGDAEAMWRAPGPQAAIEIIAEGEVETAETAGVVSGRGEPARPGVFLRSTPLTACDEAIRTLGADSASATPLDTLHELSRRVRAAVDYVQQATHGRTTAAEALQQGRGVCQDHAHIFIAAARGLGMPARYVAGYLWPDNIDEHQSHAWAEAHVPDLGWVGFDPSNQQCPTAAYVRLGCGLDAADAAPLRGWVSSAVRETLAVNVEVAQVASQQ